ncbi:hypothetical protein AMS68_001048 [Peltaster fructicola]|uniref:ABC transporter domain-containing protein n=1 Tax=Peltaster fructicola TaxID=286661 RepID=A0A6H0XLL8_9PEZI|nr:hypothetical protein AMS68_001048 [Peltaster fructicola]
MAIDVEGLTATFCTTVAIALLLLSTTWQTMFPGSTWRRDHQLPDNAEHKIYEDQDGRATEESLLKAQDIPQRLIILICSVTLLGVNIASTISGYTSGELHLSILLLIAWAILFAQSVIIAASSSTRLRFGLGWTNAISVCLLLLATLLARQSQPGRSKLPSPGIAAFSSWSLAVLEAVLAFTPQLALLQFLKALEHRDSTGGTEQPGLWIYIVALGVTSQLQLKTQEWLEWMKWQAVEIQVRAQLTVMIFAKAMRLDNVKETQDAATEVEQPAADLSLNTEHTPLLRKGGSVSDDESDDEDEEEEDDTVARGVINLVKVDAETISINCAEGSELLANFIKLGIALAILISILGWFSTLAGMAVPLLFAPITKVGTARYTKAQTKASRARDRKTSVVTEALQGMRQIKFAAVERQWHKLFMAARSEELLHVRVVFMWRIILNILWTTIPVLLGVVALTVYALTNGRLEASVAFTALAIFSSLETTLSYIPALIADLADCYVSLRRLQTFLRQAEKDDYLDEGATLKMENASISWPSSQKSDKNHTDEESGSYVEAGSFILAELDLDFPERCLSIILGKTGSGKSLLLAGLVGEARLLHGRVTCPRQASQQLLWNTANIMDEHWIIPSAKAFVAQIPWIENASVKDNILYGLPYRVERYKKVLHACALEADLLVLVNSDDTEVGANGVGLSGGQKWRVTLARALYSRAGMLILDDIFSAVDAHVGRHILDNAILGDLTKDRTIVLATHHADLVKPVAQYVVELNNGTAKATAFPGQPRPLHKHFAQLTLPAMTAELESSGVREPRKFVEDEHRIEGSVSFSVYKTYIKASGGWWFWALVLGTFLTADLSVLATSYWVKIWTERQEETTATATGLHTFIGIFVALSMLNVVLFAAREAVMRSGILKAAHSLFEDMTKSVLRAQLRWVDTVPTGRILNRFVGDFATVDGSLAPYLAWFLDSVFMLFTILLSAALVSPITLLIMLPLALAAFYIARRYIRPARDLKRLESIADSPLLDTIGTTIEGLSTIRTFDKVSVYESRMNDLIDAQTRATYHLHLLNTWMESRMGLVGSLFEICIAIFVALHKDITSAMAGFALSFALEFSEHMLFAVNHYARLELDMNAVERIAEYLEIPHETQEGASAPTQWPSEGRIVVEDLQVTYAPDLPPAIKGVSFTIEPRERVGVVGRTGSGKSTLTLALFRFLEPALGSIYIDGISLTDIQLQELRQRLSIIPQDPILFTGTIRSNLDPFQKLSDDHLFGALRQACLLTSENNDHSRNIFEDLTSPVARSGLNFSQGERQLICLARALVTQAKIMILDEATSAVDMETDALIQRSIREGFAESTLIVIAHRLSTIVDFDKVLVMGDGRVLEYGSPLDLFNAGGEFADMVTSSGEKDKLIAIIKS